MAQIAKMDNPQAVYFHNEDGVLAFFHALSVIVINSHGANMHVPEFFVDQVPFRLFVCLFESLNDLEFPLVFQDADLSMIVMEMADEDQVGADDLPAVNVNRMRIEDDSGAFAGLQIEERLAVPAEDHLFGVRGAGKLCDQETGQEGCNETLHL